MKIIKEARTGITKVWGKQKRKEGRYRLLKYTIEEESEAGPLLYNMVSGELLALTAEEKAFLATLPGEVPEEYETLLEKHFLVPEDYEEAKSVKQIRRLLSLMQREKDVLGYTILPTTYCNARCFYCYESDFTYQHMSEETAHDVVDYIAAHCHGKAVSLSWFGGEPLLGAKIISQISKELADREIKYHSSMISNGIRFDEEMIREAKDCWKLQNVQITIDGTEEIYNEVKSYVDVTGESPYRRILKNIRLLSEAGIRVSIRINMGFHNTEDIKKLILELSEYFADCQNVSMYVHELFDGEGTEPVHYTEQEKKDFAALVNELNHYADGQGKYEKKRELPSLTLSHCMADKDGSVIIYPDGRLTKCEHFNPDAEGIGSIYSEERNQAVLDSWKEQADLPNCRECPLYPTCVLLSKCPESGSCQGIKQEEKINEVREAMRFLAEKKAQEKEGEQ